MARALFLESGRPHLGKEEELKVSLIAAVAENGVIGKEGDLPWRLRDDMRFFVRTTKGHAVIMGRLNYDSIGRPLPGRRNIVLSRNREFSAPGCEKVSNIEEALRLAEMGGETEVFIIGGAQIYSLAEVYAHRFYRTRVLAKVVGDVVFPSIHFEDWEQETIEERDADEENQHSFVVELLTRRSEPRPYG